MKKLLPLLSIALFLGFGSCTKEDIAETPAISDAINVTGIEQELMIIVNDYRKSIGRVPLALNTEAYEAAQAHNNYMISKGELSHDNFSARATALSAKTSAEMIAENVAKDYETAQAAFDKWMSSKGHRLNIESNFTHTGISVKSDAEGNYYFTQMFYR
ncbi:CAP domain-containing protein [Sediminicola luteus]|uniref:SCP domain-containing protein n=1 Tax=Sediminicola luteus TaxID=319238 RepID=A0A2A4G4M6_9FLAO|nr:CAP domain-containing protein [Sediminicola luteus]PCE62936.1 hypothetical protein B7P33_16810 [Sediminicola luteus]